MDRIVENNKNRNKDVDFIIINNKNWGILGIEPRTTTTLKLYDTTTPYAQVIHLACNLHI